MRQPPSITVGIIIQPSAPQPLPIIYHKYDYSCHNREY
jgi:hypothetical protein